MLPETLPPPHWIDTPSALHQLVSSLSNQSHIAVDTEANSLHAYHERVCLIQFSTIEGDYLVDPLKIKDLSPLAEIFSNENIEKIFHDAVYDVILLNREFGFQFKNLFDTKAAAYVLGYKAFGLASLLSEKFGITADKHNQKADWAKRPLTERMLNYARMDTHYLLELRDLLEKELIEKDRLALAQEDFNRACVPSERNDKADRAPFERIKNQLKLEIADATILNELTLCRERVAEHFKRPPFKIVNDEVLIALAQNKPAEIEELKDSGMSVRQIELFGAALLNAIQKGKTAEPVTRTPRPRPNDALLKRNEKLKAWRKKTATEMEVESDVILPRVYIESIAQANPRTKEEIQKLMQDIPWRFERFGEDILEALK